jgi:two-component system, OmpR family, phosphate regulon response regulator OmpR
LQVGGGVLSSMTELAISQSRPDAALPTVLVVDDDAQFRKMLMAVLEFEGFRAVPASTAVGLPDLVRVHQPDVVLLDQLMEPVCGIDALEALRSSGGQVPVIMLTGVPASDLLETAVETGADDYVAKPFSRAVLVARIWAILRRVRWQSREAAGTDRAAQAV